jgi:hypothetical protein
MRKSLWVIFWAMVGVFVILVCAMFILPLVRLSLGLNVFVAWPIFFVLGVILIVLTIKEKTGGMLKKFLLLTGASAVGLPVFAVLHNLVSALFNTEEPVFFILATTVCPLGFLVGMVGTIVLARKKHASFQP